MSIARWADLEDRVQKLETWAGPGQIQALIDGQQAIRADLAKVHKTLDRHDRVLTRLCKDVGTLKTDVATLKTDVATLKVGMAELLRRIPEPPMPN
jgi:septal ring factor EnvC (AmiA/AmiB activator)